jgi:hypothetical protein
MLLLLGRCCRKSSARILPRVGRQRSCRGSDSTLLKRVSRREGIRAPDGKRNALDMAKYHSPIRASPVEDGLEGMRQERCRSSNEQRVVTGSPRALSLAPRGCPSNGSQGEQEFFVGARAERACDLFRRWTCISHATACDCDVRLYRLHGHRQNGAHGPLVSASAHFKVSRNGLST